MQKCQRLIAEVVDEITQLNIGAISQSGARKLGALERGKDMAHPVILRPEDKMRGAIRPGTTSSVVAVSLRLPPNTLPDRTLSFINAASRP